MNATATPTQFLGELIDSFSRALTPQSAREILSAQVSDAAQRRMAELAEGCNRGSLTAEEQAEYRLYVEMGDMVALLRTRARLYLGNSFL